MVFPHTNSKKSLPLLKFHPQNSKFSPKFTNPQNPLIFLTKIAPRQKITPYRTPYRQNPYFTTLFRPLSHKIQLKIFTNSLSHPNFLPYIKTFLRCTIFTSKKSPFNSFLNQKFLNLQQRIIMYPTNQK